MSKKKFAFYCFLFSFFSFSYQMLLAKIMILEIGHEVIAFCGTTSLFFYGMALGNFNLKKNRPGNYSLSLIRTEFALATLAFLGSTGIALLFAISRWCTQNATYESYILFYNLGMACAFVCSLGIGFFAGKELPLLEKIGFTNADASSFGKLMLFSYIGAFSGGLLLLLWLVPMFGGLTTLLGMVCVHVISLIGLQPKPIKTILIGLALAFVAYNGNAIETQFSKISYIEHNDANVADGFSRFFMSLDSLNNFTLQRIQTKYQTADIIERTGDNSLALFLNYNYQFDSRYEASYHSAISDSLALHWQPETREILLLGAGDGLMARDLLQRFPGLTQITLVELDPEIINLGNSIPKWKVLNQGALQDSKVKIIVTDAYSFLRNSTKKWDAVVIDFPYPTSFDISRLYSVEFYQHLKRSLNEHGFFVFDFPLREHAAEIFSTLRASGFEHFVGLERGETFVIVSMKNNLKVDELKKLGFQSILSPSQDGTPPNTIDRPTLPRFM